MTIEQQTSGAVLQQGKHITIGDRDYVMPKPSVATIIMVSELVSTLPAMDRDSDAVLQNILATAKDSKVLGEIIAVLVMGADAVITERNKVIRNKWWKFWQKDTDKVAELSDYALRNLSASQMSAITSTCLGTLEIGNFFALTTSLTMANVLKRTKSEVEKSPTTASGH